MKDLKNNINTLMKTGKSSIGSKEVIANLLIEKPKLIIISSNCPEKQREQITYYTTIAKVPLKTVKEDSKELGSICRKPFPVSAISILDEGDSTILSSAKE